MQESGLKEFILHEAYPSDVYPLLCVQGGSRAYNLSGKDSDYDMLGIHFMDSLECLEHPDFRQNLQVLRYKFDENFNEIPNGVKGGMYSVDSFETWKFISLYVKGSFVSYELLHLPSIFKDPKMDSLTDIMKIGLTSRIGRAARGNAVHDWGKRKKDRKKAVMSYYRLIQAIHFLRELHFEYDAQKLIEYIKPSGLIPVGEDIITKYRCDELRTEKLSDNELNNVVQEIGKLIDETDKARMVTRLPDRCPAAILEELLQKVKTYRTLMV